MNKKWTTVHICNMEKTGPDLMLDVFCACKVRTGFVPCSAEEAEQTYLISYRQSDVYSWLTVSGTHWQEQPYPAAGDPFWLSMDYRMPCLYVQLQSIGSATLELYDPFCASAGIRKIGEGVSEPDRRAGLKPEYWQEFADTIASQPAFDAVLGAQYRSAEETAAALAALLHTEQEQFFADAQSGDADAVRLYFRSAPAASKKLTVKAAFKKVYGEALKPLGFAYAKTKEPCFIRVISEELIHVIGIHEMRDFLVPFGGVLTLYNSDFLLDRTYRDMGSFLPDVSFFWMNTHTDADEAPDPRLHAKFSFQPKLPESVLYTMRSALAASLRWILPQLDPVQSLRDFPAYYQKLRNGRKLGIARLPHLAHGYGDAVIRYLLEDPVAFAEQYIAESEAAYKAKFAADPELFPPENVKSTEERNRVLYEEIRESVYAFAEDPAVRQQTLDELERGRMKNLEKLRAYGVL